MRHIINAIPNVLTSANLICGVAATYCSSYGDFKTAFWLIVTAAVFDFFDGFAARMLKAYSPIGGQLDSLADMVSFGVAPAMAVFSMLCIRIGNSAVIVPFYAYIAFLLAVFAALRLAKFNIDTRQSEEFRGLPTPAMSLFFFSWTLSYNEVIATDSDLMIYTTIALVLLFCSLMVSELRMFSFKFKNFGFVKNSLRYFFAIFAVIMVILTGYASAAIIVASYIVVSLINAISRK